MSEWKPLGPSRFVDKRTMLRRDGNLVHQNVSAYRAVVVRRGEDGKPEYERCPHAHLKARAARACAERAARRFNREDAAR